MSCPGSPSEDDIFSVERHEEDGLRHLRLSGVIDEFADLSFFAHLRGRVTVSLGEVRRINSFGVRLWIDAVRAIGEETEVTFVDVPVVLVEQANMIHRFFGRGRVESFQAPMVCGTCGRVEKVLFSVEEARRKGEVSLQSRCAACEVEMELDDIEEQYLAFLKDY